MSELRWYAVACGLKRENGPTLTHSITLHTVQAVSEGEAKGQAVSKALQMKPGFSVWEVICTDVPASGPETSPQPLSPTGEP